MNYWNWSKTALDIIKEAGSDYLPTERQMLHAWKKGDSPNKFANEFLSSY